MIEGETILNSRNLLEKTTNQNSSWWEKLGGERAGDEEYGAEDEFSFLRTVSAATKRKSPWKVPPNKVLSNQGLP